METIPKCVKQHSFEIDNNTMDELWEIANRYGSVKNYVYSRYSGIGSLLIVENHLKQIRDVWVKNGFAEQWQLPARYWKMALSEAIANIKTEWANTKLRIKKAVYQNENLTEDEKHFIYYTLKANKILYAILNKEPFNKPKKLENLVIREKYIFNLIRRYVRKYKGKVPYTHNKSLMLDFDMYNYRHENEELYLDIMGLQRGKRLPVKLRDHNIHEGNIRIVLKDNTIEVHKVKYIKQKELFKYHNPVGVDKGYRNLIASSTGNIYGNELGDMLSEETERLNKKNAERNKFRNLYKQYIKKGKTKKAQNILGNNLGRKKYDRQKQKNIDRIKSYINHELNRFFYYENPSEVVIEDLTFVSWDNIFPKHIRRKLASWCKGYINDRISYKAGLFSASMIIVNAAYTSKVCSKCGRFGKRDGDEFECPVCGILHADKNASLNVLMRKDDNEIGLYTPYKQVKEILEARLKKTLQVSA